MRETKGTFKKNQMQAEEFVSKLRDEKKNAKQEAMKIRKKELQNHQKVRQLSIKLTYSTLPISNIQSKTKLIFALSCH